MSKYKNLNFGGHEFVDFPGCTNSPYCPKCRFDHWCLNYFYYEYPRTCENLIKLSNTHTWIKSDKYFTTKDPITHICKICTMKGVKNKKLNNDFYHHNPLIDSDVVPYHSNHWFSCNEFLMILANL